MDIYTHRTKLIDSHILGNSYHKVCVAYVMFDETTSHDDHSGVHSLHSHAVESPKVYRVKQKNTTKYKSYGSCKPVNNRSLGKATTSFFSVWTRQKGLKQPLSDVINALARVYCCQNLTVWRRTATVLFFVNCFSLRKAVKKSLVSLSAERSPSNATNANFDWVFTKNRTFYFFLSQWHAKKERIEL